MKIKKIIITTVGILFLCVLLVSIMAESNATAEPISNGSSSSNAVGFTTPIPLTASDISNAWPDLPSANQVYNSGSCSIVDLNTFGKSVPVNTTTGLPSTSGVNPNSQPCFNVSSTIVNCTSTVLNYQTGQYISNVPTIWLQYNTTIWVQVPYNDLETGVQPYATAINLLTGNSISTSPMTTSSTTWSIGEYDNPSAISGSYSIEGAVSYGEWTLDTLP